MIETPICVHTEKGVYITKGIFLYYYSMDEWEDFFGDFCRTDPFHLVNGEIAVPYRLYKAWLKAREEKDGS